MEMTPIPSWQFYYFQRKHLVSYIETKADNEMKQLRSDLEAANEKVVVQFDARHASAVCSKHSTAAWIDNKTGKVIECISETHQANKGGSGSFELRAFKDGMRKMLTIENLNIIELIHDDCSSISAFIRDIVSLYIMNITPDNQV